MVVWTVAKSEDARNLAANSFFQRMYAQPNIR